VLEDECIFLMASFNNWLPIKLKTRKELTINSGNTEEDKTNT
jgi:hypothetical protein